MKKRWLLVILACLALIGGAIASVFMRRDAPGAPYLIGASLPLTKGGEPNAEGEAMRQALQLFADALNKKGGIGNRPLALSVKDDQNDRSLARTNAEQFVANQDVLAVIGHQFSSVAIAAGEAYESGELVHISPSASNPAVTRGRDWVFSMNYQDEMQGESTAVYLQAVLNAENVVVIFADDAYGRGLRDSFAPKAKSIGLGIAQQISYSYERFKQGQLEATFARDHWTADRDGVDAVVLFSHTGDGAALVQQLREAGIAAPVIGPDAFAKAAFIKALGQHTADVLVVGPFLYELSSLKTKRFVDEYRKRYQGKLASDPTVWAAFSYDALSLVSAAITDGATTRDAIRAYLKKLSAPGAKKDGITGRLHFDDHGAMERPIVVSMIEDGVFKPALTQIKQVSEPHVLANLDERVRRGDVVVVDRVPYYRTAVVYAGIDFIRINKVDVVGQNFDLEFFLWFRWAGDGLDTSKIDFLNGIFGIEDKVEVLREDLTKPIRYRCYKIKGTYLYPYRLQSFPFDTQHLPMTLAHKTKDANQLMLVMDKNKLSAAPIEKIYPEEWEYLERVDFAGTYDEVSTFGDPGYPHGTVTPFSVYETNIVIKRITFPYLFKLFLPLLMMIAITGFVFMVPLESFDARMTLVMTALLSVLLFHMAQGDTLPSVGYMVKADQYFVVTYIMLFTVILLTIGVNLLAKYDKEALARTLFRRCGYILVPGTLAAFAYITFTAF